MNSMSADLNQDRILHIAKLSRLQLDPEKIPLYEKRFSDILKLIQKISALDTQKIKPMKHPFETPGFLREDEISETPQKEVYLKLSAHSDEDFFIVPKVIEEQG